MLSKSTQLGELGIDAIAIKPSKVDISTVEQVSTPYLVIDFEGVDHLPRTSTVEALAEDSEVVMTAPIRADGFDPLGDDTLLRSYGDLVTFAFVAGHPAYLNRSEVPRAVAPRLTGALDRFGDALVGTEGIERLALTTGAPQYELLSRSTAAEVRGLRRMGFDGEVFVYAPLAVSEDEDLLLDTLGSYVSRRSVVANRLSDGVPTDRHASGSTREILLDAITEYTIAGSDHEVRKRVDALKRAGIDAVVAHPALGLDRVD